MRKFFHWSVAPGAFPSISQIVVAFARVLILLAGLQAGSPSSRGAEDAQIKLQRPVAWQVVQREGFVPAQAHVNNPGGAALGFADVRVGGRSSISNVSSWEYRVVLLDKSVAEPAWQKLDVTQGSDEWSGNVRVAAGGWYRLEIRVMRDGQSVAQSSVEPFGVGEVFLVAGQSYAVGANDELMKVEDSEQRVSAYNFVSGTWQVANDPLPNAGDGGTIWPPLGDILVPLARVPIGFVNVAAGGTASRQWMPGEPLYKRLAEAGQRIGRFRAVLWQQGESDVIEKVSTETYVSHLTTIRQDLERTWGFAPPWLLAKSTLHPTVYIDPVHEGQIRDAIDRLCRINGFQHGPDTDILGGINRGGPDTRRHFSGIGQRRAAWLWFASIWQVLNQPSNENGQSKR